MLPIYKEKIQIYLKSVLEQAFSDVSEWPDIVLEVPGDKKHGHFSSNIALRCAKLLRKAPPVIATEFVQAIEGALKGSELETLIDRVEVKNPGFINFFLTNQALVATLEEIYQNKQAYGQTNLGQGKRLGSNL